MRGRGRTLLLTVAILAAFWLVFSRLRIVVWVHASFGQILIVFLVLAAAVFLGLDYVVNRGKP